MTRTALGAALLMLGGSLVSAQTPAELEAEPIVKLQPGETEVSGQCLAMEELDLIADLNALRRPTLGVEGEGDGDEPAPFDPHYFIGTWEIEGVLPDSAFGESSEFFGFETVRHVGGCTYDSVIQATRIDGEVTIESRMVYDRRLKYLVRRENNSRGFELLKVGRVGGDPGGYFSHHWEAAPITRLGKTVRLTGRTFVLSPFFFEVRMRISQDGEPATSFGTLRWERVEDEL